MLTVSIIVPVYNVEKFIHRCVDSILMQTFADFELILVDDGSPDNCPVICDEYAKKDSRIKVIHKQNGGLADARNAGLDIAVGKYILFCDSDDYVLPEWCEHFIVHVNNSQDNCIFGGFNIVKPDKEKIYKPATESKTYHIDELFCSKFGFAWNVLYYADVLKKYNIRFPTNVTVEDWPFNLQYLMYMNCLDFTGFYEYNYYQDDRETLSRKYYPGNFERWQEKYKVTRWFIDEKLSESAREKAKAEAADQYLYQFLNSLNNTFDERNTWSLKQKLVYNINVVNSDEFQECLRYADCSRENQTYISLLKNKKYKSAYLLQRAARLKQKLGGH